MILIYSDLHIGLHGKQLDEAGNNIRLMDVLAVQEQIFEYALANDNITEVWFLGDLIDPKVKVPVVVLSETKKRFTNFKNRLQVANRTIKLKYMTGNHDQYLKNNENHSVNILLGDVDVIDQPQTHFYDENTLIHWMPFIRDTETILTTIRSLQCMPEKRNILLIHQTITGCVTGPINYLLEDSGLSSEELTSFDLVFSGHIHKPQELDNNRIIYVGSPLQIDWGEHKEKGKGFILFNPEDLSWQRMSCQSPEYYSVDSDEPDHAQNVVIQLLNSGVRPWMIRIKSSNENVATQLNQNPDIPKNIKTQIIRSDQDIIKETTGSEEQPLDISGLSNEQLVTSFLKIREDVTNVKEIKKYGLELFTR